MFFLGFFGWVFRLLKEVLAAWRTEVDKKPATMSIDDAYTVSS
jgi:hypothetical protein